MARHPPMHLAIVIVLGLSFIVLFNHQVDGETNVKQHQNASCTSTLCSCCLETVQCPADGQCGGQCKDGFFGGKCFNSCPAKCVRCKDPDNPTNDASLHGVANCTACNDGHYSTVEYYQCQFNCPPECQACSSATECTSCNTGYDLRSGQCLCQDGFYKSDVTGNLKCVSCSNGCNNNCDRINGTCECKVGYNGHTCDSCNSDYYKHEEYCFPCPLGCVTCTSADNCISCVNGYHMNGNNCERSCGAGCDQCHSFDNCYQCSNDYYMSATQCVACSTGCDNQCNKTSGGCTCKTGYTGIMCDSCVDGWYMMSEGSCLQCKSPCATCTSSSHTCTSCITGHHMNGNNCQPCPTNCAQCSSGTSCDRCMTGYYRSGTGCIACHVGCYNGQCDETSGSCTCRLRFDGEKCDQCASNFQTSPDCNQCIAGYHGDKCDQDCPVNCNQNVCGRYDRKCSNGCIDNFSGERCDTCLTGRHDEDCSSLCPGNCAGACNRSSGHCHSCKINFTGETCDSCTVGKYGNNCDIDCSSNCNDTCKRNNGECDSCKNGLYGNKCNVACSNECANGICGQSNGICTGGCTSGFSGDMCCQQGSNCSKCSSTTECSKCVPGKYGDTCSSTCPDNCYKVECHKDNGTCVGCTDGYQGYTCETVAKSKGDPEGPDGTVIGAAVGGVVVLAIIVVVAVFLFRFYRNRPTTRESVRANKEPEPASFEKETVYVNGPAIAIANENGTTNRISKAPQLSPSSGYDIEEEEELVENDYYNSLDCVQRGIAVEDLAAYVDGKDEEFFNTEFHKLPKGLIKPHEEAMKDQNQIKNRYNGIYPYDETRVILKGPGSDFINACYIEGFRKHREYIASLGPIAKATEGYSTFWRMVWQEKTEKIVMVTNLMEAAGMKCEMYWPEVKKTAYYGDIKVTGRSEDVYSEYTVRSFTVHKGKEVRSLHHIHYTAWPDKGVPDDVTSIIEFRNKVNSIKTPLKGPIIVHCSAGVGRTGTYIAIDILTLKGKKTGYVDIFDCVDKLRQQRTIMVQTPEQYEYVHRAVVHTLTLGSEAIPADKFQGYVSTISKDIFDKLSHCKEKLRADEPEAIARNKESKDLNRPGSDIPGDNNRPRLFQGRTAEDINYINALYINSFQRKNQFIMTQTPLQSTVDDFLALVVQEKCSCIVSMDPVGLSDNTVGTYLPADNQELRLAEFEVKSHKVESNESYTLRTLTITFTLGKTDTHTVKHFQFPNWPKNLKAPGSAEQFLKLVKAVQAIADGSGTYSPVIVHCLTSSMRSGLLCVVVSLLQKMEIEHEVSVINTVRQVKLRRPRAIPTMEQFVFCHECVATYLRMFDIYGNFS